MAQTKYVKRMTNFRSEVFDLIQGECALRRNGGKGFSLTINQIVLEYFALRTPELEPEDIAGKPILVEQPA